MPPSSATTQSPTAHVYRQPQLVRFTNYHPVHHTESFFFNVLLARVPFRHEEELLSPDNTCKSYFTECQLRGYTDTEEGLEAVVLQYTQDHLYSIVHTDTVLKQVVDNAAACAGELGHVQDDPQALPEKADFTSDALLQEFAAVRLQPLTDEQRVVSSSGRARPHKQKSALCLVSAMLMPQQPKRSSTRRHRPLHAQVRRSHVQHANLRAPVLQWRARDLHLPRHCLWEAVRVHLRHVYHIEPIVHPTPDALSLDTITGFADWASDAQHKHHLLRCVASGCKVLLRSNMDFRCGSHQRQRW